ncbi:MAG TPA: sigma-70 family RNA polymerase sigma factor [Myxococcota bacterium]|nr:sigma-70 family RNA polymerase sigma factor [Myxococcota bacterium]
MIAPPTDDTLIARIQQRDTAAFRALFDRYYTRVFSFAERRLGDPELSEEVVADAFFEVWRGAPAFRGASRVSTWLFGIATFKCREADRNRRRLKRASVIPAEPALLQAVTDDREILERLEARSDLRWLRRRFEELPTVQREVAELAGQEESVDEMAGKLGVSPGTVKSRLSRARRALRSTPPTSRGEVR